MGIRPALTAALQNVTFTPAAASAGSASTSTTVSLSVTDVAGGVSAVDTATRVTATPPANTPPVLGGSGASVSTTDKATSTP